MVLGTKPPGTRGTRDFRDDREQIDPWEEIGPQEKWSRRRGLCAHSPFKKKDGGGGHACEKGKKKKRKAYVGFPRATDVKRVHPKKEK